ncbi:NAD(P)-dependent alcohol dehydrogenase [Leifsonia flava]|uniref:NAD(P)-dependent alcohol dehydrogenase n=1 Tax=Orlajensenia leifsoniae TaxID=2561933 RepID=A0A4Y9R4P9_9MICO|nr:NAD(P)-dependent alcohol dehydrogenase [Leifsonia flava]TFV98693.1 NAD(P)-dependent alcohol dehydrogenase [Leifsonia flava]
MKQARYSRYGGPDVVDVTDAPTPVAAPGEVVIRVRAATVGAADAAARAGSPAFARLYFGLRHPRIPVLGSDVAGEIVSVGDAGGSAGGTGGGSGGGSAAGAGVASGAGDARFRVGDRVFGVTGSTMGGHATHVVLPTDAALALQPSGVTDAESAALVDATALAFLRDAGRLRSGQRLLVIGASGSVGSMAVQLGVHFGAHVTGVCSGPNVELVRSLGAERVVDYTREDWWAASVGDDPRPDARYDVIFDAVGASSYRRARPMLADGGAYLRTVPTLAILLQMAWTSLTSRLHLGRTRAAIAFTGLRPTSAHARDLAVTVGLVESGALRAVIDSTYPLERIADAHRRVDTHRKRGAVIVTME